MLNVFAERRRRRSSFTSYIQVKGASGSDSAQHSNKPLINQTSGYR